MFRMRKALRAQTPAVKRSISKLDAVHYGHVRQPLAAVDEQPLDDAQFAGHTDCAAQEVVAEHETSQAHEDLQSTPLTHAPPAQLTLHAPVPHRTGLEHALVPQVTAQLLELRQSADEAHAPLPHVTTQAPTPHRIGLAQALVPVHSIWQLEALLQSTPPRQALSPHTT